MTCRLGELIDRLVTTNVRLYHVQDLVHAAARTGEGISADTVQKQVSLNSERNRLMSEIEECVNRAIGLGSLPVHDREKV